MYISIYKSEYVTYILINCAYIFYAYTGIYDREIAVIDVKVLIILTYTYTITTYMIIYLYVVYIYIYLLL